MSRPMTRALIAFSAALAFAGAAFWCYLLDSHDLDATLAAARAAFEERRFADAVRLSRRVLTLDENNAAAIVIGGASATAEQQFDQAWSFYSQLGEIDTSQKANAGSVAAHLLAFQRHQLSSAVNLNLKVLRHDPQHVGANSGYADLLGLTGQRWEAIPPTLKLIRLGAFSTSQLILIGSETGVHDDAPLLKACVEAAPDDPLAALGMGWNAYRAGRLDESRCWAALAVKLDPQQISAQALLGGLLAAPEIRLSEFVAWNSQLCESAREHPEIWLALGQRAQVEGMNDAAIRCYWESIRRNPNYRLALNRMSQLLLQPDEVERAQPFLHRLELLQELKDAEAALFTGVQESLKPLQRVAEQMERLGRYWEAWGWSQLAQRLDPQAAWPPLMIESARRRLTDLSPLTDEASNPALHVDLSMYPVPDWPVTNQERQAFASTNSPIPTAISFSDDAAATGIHFTYFNSADPQTAGQQMFEFTGGGVGSTDFDLDSWPDLYFTQGCKWPVELSQTDYLDRLYRNLGTGQFQDVTDSCGIRESGFGQGLSFGDYDNDGFPDLLVANIGGNRLFHNEGDGTFCETTHLLPPHEGRWTTSCAIADLNGDTWPDLYAVNYLYAEDVFERMCHHKDGVPRMCAPFEFPAAESQFLLNNGDGSFSDASVVSGLAAPNGKGLGLLIADFHQSGKLDVFVANDLVSNFFYTNRAPHRGGSPEFEEVGLSHGVALNADGQAQGCMGIAADDFNGDGKLDLFVTNFYMESNTLYLQVENDAFVDATASVGLTQPSLPVLGFGVQSIDADVDGLRDFLVTNGHVDDQRAYGQPYAMRPQIFRGREDGIFQEISPQSAGPFFQREYLGRGMCRLDWNRDGREDIAISHLEAPAALLTNRTTSAGHSLVMHLRGIVSDRDAIGAIVTVLAGERKQTQHLTAGDGYQGCNQRSLTFGLGQHTLASEVTIRWPSGIRQTFLNVQANHEWLCLEEQPDLIPISPVIPQSASVIAMHVSREVAED
ncbi:MULTISPECIES: FG-GAP-like repeat-containing protein [unclassified Schlesneria]|uniref:FG-GAP-like repeat-containing protein n=1 Tax=Schlesneria TaxID=656899 RepID=UPI00359FE46A